MKPRIIRATVTIVFIYGYLLPGWSCRGGGAEGCGVTPEQAYEAWSIKRRLRKPERDVRPVRVRRTIRELLLEFWRRDARNVADGPDAFECYAKQGPC